MLLLLVILPLCIVAAHTTLELFRDLNDFTLSRREAVAFLAATTLKEKLDRTIDVGISLSTRVQFQGLAEAGKWDEAVKIFERVPRDFTYIDRVSLFDPQGILRAATEPTPEILSVIGKDFSYRDYYQGVSKNCEPYIAEAIKPAVPLGYNLVPVAIPIKSPSGKILGMVLLNIKLDTVSAWSKNINVGPASFVYIVDHKGHLIAHPTLLPAEDIVDFSSVPAVQKILKGERGVEVLFNQIENEERVTAYEPVPSYGWGVIVVQPTRTAFSERNKAVGRLAVIWTLVIFSIGFFAHRLLRDRVLIKSQRDRERLLLDSIADGVIAIDRAWNIISWNKSATAVTGWSREEALGKPMRKVIQFIRESDKKENIVFIEEVMLYGEQRSMENHTLLTRKDGTEIYVGDSAAPVFDASGKVSGAIIIFRDVSKEHEVQKIKEEILSETIHDLRAPATAIKSAAALYGDPEELAKDPGALKEGVEIIKEANARMLDLINTLLAKARGEANTIERERVSLSAVISNIVKESGPVAARKNVKIEYVLPLSTEKPSYVLANAGRLKEIFSNLVDNAIKYNKGGGIVTIVHQAEGSLVKTTVRDTGMGISTENLSRLFAPYFRASTREEIQGTGLGLFTTKKFVEEAGGSITVDSKLGIGTTFTVSFPLAEN